MPRRPNHSFIADAAFASYMGPNWTANAKANTTTAANKAMVEVGLLVIAITYLDKNH
jgi:hypothetical protein